jgi:hypothetical protein
MKERDDAVDDHQMNEVNERTKLRTDERSQEFIEFFNIQDPSFLEGILINPSWMRKGSKEFAEF